jgi:hypothetical protein
VAGPRLPFLECRLPALVKFLISFSTSRMNGILPPAGENTTVNLGHDIKQQVRSGFPADRGHNQNNVDGTVVAIATPSLGVERNPRYG